MILNPTALGAALLLLLPLHDITTDLQPGDAMPMPDRAMKDVMGGDIALAKAKGENGLLVIFSCNTCPFVIGSDGSAGWEGRYPELGSQCRKQGIGMVLVNSNEAKRDAGDGFADMQAHYKEKNYNSHYVLDEGNTLADAFGARTTPHVYLFNKELKLVYKGAIDDNVDDPKAVTKHYLSDALDAMVAGKTVDPAITRNLGCSIKRAVHEP